ncbi:unnamed protein product [Haemonchus placei]|uniref:Protein kinase domain-containing protein n=1 Tax=Haemonchus placei TaxID=6290 RepID=A0A0N4VUE0_HAEPC|nr:unnamed protein product [Haemonchus placei]
MKPSSFMVKGFIGKSRRYWFGRASIGVHLVDSHEALLIALPSYGYGHTHLKEIIHNEKSYKFVVVDINARLGEAQEEEYRMWKVGMGTGTRMETA